VAYSEAQGREDKSAPREGRLVFRERKGETEGECYERTVMDR